MKPGAIIKKKKVSLTIKAKPFPDKLPDGILFPEKLALANKIFNSSKATTNSRN